MVLKKTNKKIFLILLIFSVFLLGLIFGEYNVFKIRKFLFNSDLYHFYKEINNSRYDVKQIPELNLKISEKNFNKIKNKRKQALKSGYLLKNPNDDVPIKIKFKDSIIDGKMRLKGALKDHWNDVKKWSFKINTKNNLFIQNQNKFSLQHPKTRNYLNEWVFQKLMKREKIISLEYRFVKLFVNDVNYGIYAIEEGINNNLLKNNNLINGPIIKFSQKNLFSSFNENKHRSWIEFYNDTFLKTEIVPFQKKKILNDSSLNEMYIEAKRKLDGFRTMKLKTHEVFDFEKLSKYIANLVLFSGDHGFLWNNMRFYYNPKTKLLEPIAYDSNCGFNNILLPSNRNILMEELFLSDSIFYYNYLQELNKVSKEEYLDSLFESLELSLMDNVYLLKSEFDDFNFDKEVFYIKSKIIKTALNNTTDENIIMDIENVNSDTFSLSIKNYSLLPIKINEIRILEKTLKVPNTIIPPRLFFVYPKEEIFKLKKSEINESKITVLYTIFGSSIKKKIDIIF